MSSTTAPSSVPEFTLGWTALDWISANLRQPDGDDAGAPLALTREQALFVLSWYELREVRGRVRWRYRRGQLRRMKGWGKSPFEAALGLFELAGPCRYAGRDAAGQPVGKPHPLPWVSLAGVSQEQTDNTMNLVGPMLDGSAIADEFDVGLTRVFHKAGGKLAPITASAKTQEGARTSATFGDESHLWMEANGGHKLAQVLRRNAAKSRDGSSRILELTNAHEPGQDSVAERTHLAWLAQTEGRTRGGVDILLDTLEMPADVDWADPDDLRRGLIVAAGDSWAWLDLDRIVADIYDPDQPIEVSRRFYGNQLIAAADSWVTPQQWDANKTDVTLEPGDTICLGFDGGRSDDSTALAACRLSDGAVFLLGLWEKPDGPAAKNWVVNRDAVRDQVEHAFTRFDVVGFAADEALWQSDIDAWAAIYRDQVKVKASTKHPIGLYMSDSKDLTRSVEAVHTAIEQGALPHAGDSRMDRHVYNARRRPNRWGVSFGKEQRESPKKVDALSAMVLARMMRQRAVQSGVGESGYDDYYSFS